MRFPDWRAYETGELSVEERASTESLLVESEAARLDFAAFQEYKRALRQAAVEDQPSFGHLNSLLERAQGRKRFSRTLVPLLAGAAMIVATLTIGPFLRSREPAIGTKPPVAQSLRLETSDPQRAYEWIGMNVDFMIPPYRLTATAKLTGASAGQGWGAYEYELDGKPMKLVVRPNAYDFKAPETTQIGRTTFYVGESIGFKCPYCSYELEGGEEADRWKLAKAAATELFGGL